MGPIRVRAPTVISHVSIQVLLELTYTPSPSLADVELRLTCIRGKANVLDVVSVVQLYGSIDPWVVIEECFIFFRAGCRKGQGRSIADDTTATNSDWFTKINFATPRDSSITGG